MADFYFLRRNTIFEKNTKAIVHGFSEKWVFRYEKKSNSFLSGCTSIHVCPESTCQKFQSQRVYLSSKTYTYVLYIKDYVYMYLHCTTNRETI